MPTTPQQEWDQAQPETPQQEWESATPAPSLDGVDPNRLTQALIDSQTLGISPDLAYDQSDEIQKQMKDHGGGTWKEIVNDIKVGGENSIFGLAYRNKLPEPLQNDDAMDKFVSGLTTMVSDLPFYIAGGYIGAVAGGLVGGAAGLPEGGIGAVPGAAVGAEVGGAMGTFAIPDMIRKTLTDGIEKGDITSFGDFSERTVGIAWAGTKGAATGLTMEAAGAGTLPALGKGAVSLLARKAQQTAAITIVPKLLEGQLPTAQDFGVNAALVGALHLVSKGTEVGTSKARLALLDAYAKDGTLPRDAVTKLQAQPPVQPELEPGLRSAIQITRAAGSDMDSADVLAANAATSGKVVIEADEGEVHPELAKRIGLSVVSLDELERDHALADKILEQPEAQLQQVIDRAVELKKEEIGEAKEPPKSGRGFTTPDGKFLSREQARSWVKKNEPEIYEKWADIAGDEKAEFHSEDYGEARERVHNRTLAEGDPDLAAWSPQLARFVARMRTELNVIKAGGKSDGYGKAVLRTLFVGPRNMLRVEANQLRSSIEKLIPDEQDQGALTFYRDWKGDPEGLRSAIEEIRVGENEKLKSSIPARERALTQMKTPSPEFLQADARMTAYFKNALELGQQIGFLESNIDPERYSPRLFTKALEGEEETRREGRPRFTTRTPNAIRRQYLNEYDALKSGDFEARTFNALDELSVYGDRHATAVATNLFKTELKNSELAKNGSRSTMPSDWVELPGSHKPIITKNSKTGETEVFQTGFHVPKVVADAMAPILEQRNSFWNLPVISQFRQTQIFQKAVELGLSVFHIKAESLMAWGNMGTGDLIKTLRSDNSSPEFQAAEREAALWGLNTTMTGRSDVHEGLTGGLPSKLQVLRKVTGVKQLDQAAQAVTHATFDVIQRKFKVMDFSLKQAAWMANHPEATDAEYSTAMRSISKEVNAVYGGLNWEVMGWGPNAREIARAFILAPDWTFSNLANVKYAFEGGPGGAAARSFWFKSATTGLAMTAAMSLLVTGQLSKHPTEVYLGKDKQGKEIYSNIFFAGAPKDAITWLNRVQKDGGLTGTVDFMAYKAAPMVGIIPRLFINKDWAGRPITTPKEGVVEKTARQVGFAAEQAAPLPFSIKDAIEGMLNDSERDYTYKDFLLGIAGSTAIHEGGKKRKTQRKFTIRTKP